jgi:glycosyltransferase involved in cell wall biosynthesis
MVMVAKDGGDKPVSHQRQEAKDNLYLAAREHPDVQAVLKRFPAARVQVFGGGNRGGLRSPNVDFLGRIPQGEFARALGNAALGVAPIRLGTGVKVKVLDMMWHGLPVVSTTLASRGTPAEHGAALIADTPATFAEAVCELLGSRARRLKLQGASQKLLFERHASPAARDCVAGKLLGWADVSAHPLTPVGARSLCGSRGGGVGWRPRR